MNMDSKKFAAVPCETERRPWTRPEVRKLEAGSAESTVNRTTDVIVVGS